jgi:hypothetical protein
VKLFRRTLVPRFPQVAWQRTSALLPAILQFMKLHFDFDAFVACLNHGMGYYAAEAALASRLFVFNTRLTVSSSSSGRKGFGTHSKPP